MNSLFVGLITHKNSKYLNAYGEHLQFSALILLLKPNKTKISMDNVVKAFGFKASRCNILFDTLYLTSIFFTIQAKLLQQSLFKNLNIVLYNIFLQIIYISQISLKIIFSLFSVKANHELCLHVSRQINITNAHKTLLKDSLKSDSKFSLILEDDFYLNNDLNLVEIMSNLFDYLNQFSETLLIDLSESFSIKELGLEFVVTKSYSLPVNTQLKIFSFKQSVSNTVCATLYRNSCIPELLLALDDLDKFPSIPIDHKINIALHKLTKNSKVLNDAYAILEPGIFIQQSLKGDLP
jgi:hypothetical protein